MSSRASLRTRVREKVDEATASFWSDTLINNQLQESLNYYWAWIIKTFEGYFTKTSYIDFDANTDGEYAVPADFFKVRLLSRSLANAWVPLRYNERFETTIDKAASTSIYALPNYRFRGTKLRFEPAPNFSETSACQLEYVRTLPALSDIQDVDDEFAAIPMAEDCVVCRAVIKCKSIEEMVAGGGADSDPFIKDLLSTEQMLKEALEQRITARLYVEQFGEDDNTLIQNLL